MKLVEHTMGGGGRRKVHCITGGRHGYLKFWCFLAHRTGTLLAVSIIYL